MLFLFKENDKLPQNGPQFVVLFVPKHAQIAQILPGFCQCYPAESCVADGNVAARVGV